MPGSRFIRLSNTFAFPYPKLPTIGILYGWSGIAGQFGLYSFMFSFVASSKLIVKLV